MPLYEFCCEACGTFERLLSFGKAGASSPCPRCAAPSRRLYSSPNVSSTTRAQGIARRINEGGAEPKVLRRSPDGADTKPAKPSGRGGGRPWQISH